MSWGWYVLCAQHADLPTGGVLAHCCLVGDGVTDKRVTEFGINRRIGVAQTKLITAVDRIDRIVDLDIEIVDRCRESLQECRFEYDSESDRIRINTDVKLRNELIRDFFWELRFYSNYDNRPVEGAEKEDYGFITSLGASF